MNQPINCKYTPLENHLRALSDTRSELTLTFEQIEMVMHSKLPNSAHISNAWWDNAVKSTLSHKYAWLHAGWQVEEVDLSARRVRFVRRIDKGKYK
jgi:hypothetical protein